MNDDNPDMLLMKYIDLIISFAKLFSLNSSPHIIQGSTIGRFSTGIKIDVGEFKGCL